MGQPNTMKSFALVLVQFATLGLIAITGPIFAPNPILLAVELLGIGLGVWAVFTIGIGKFNILPDPLTYSRLVRRGPYRLIRHPMYLGLLLVSLPLVVTEFTTLRLALWLLLLVDLLLKIGYEESLLVGRLVDYKEYMEHSYRLVPFVY